PVLSIVIFYVNYFVLIDKFFFNRKKLWIFILLNLLFIVIAVLFRSWIDTLLPPRPEFFDVNVHLRGTDSVKFNFEPHLTRDLIMLLLTISLAVAVRLLSKFNKLNNAQLELVAKQRESELKNLKSQLNPHFLFNTLNNIYALIAVSPAKAQLAVHELGNLLRYVLYENKEQEVELSKEIGFIENYISLMKLRLSPDVVLNVNIERTETENIKIAPLMFVSLVENAFKHGISNSKPSYISISLLSDNQKVMCTIENSNFPKPKSDKSGSGIGLKNLQKQLSILYPDCSDLSIQSDDDKFRSVLTIYYKKRQDNEKTQMLRD
ncbi:MAG: sensor histidine kinase, partial [Muribaculaceae bacterium]